MEDKLFDQLMTSLEDAIAYSQGDRNRCREVIVEAPDPVSSYKAIDRESSVQS